MVLTFHKMHGLGNDFVLLDLRQQVFSIDKTVARKLANRHTGIGCDQILILRKPGNTLELASFEIWNADGSRAEQCGNGVRCLGLYLNKFSDAPSGSFILGGPAELLKLNVWTMATYGLKWASPCLKTTVCRCYWSPLMAGIRWILISNTYVWVLYQWVILTP